MQRLQAQNRWRIDADLAGRGKWQTRVVSMTKPRAVFAFLGFEFRWVPSAKTGRWYPHLTPRRKKITGLLQSVRETLRASRHLPTQVAVARVNAITRGWVNYFRVGNSSRAFAQVRFNVERSVRRFVARRSQRKGYGWKRWSNDIVYGTWGLFRDYRIVYTGAKARTSRTDS